MKEVLEPKIVYQEANPYGSFTAYLEDDGQTVYLYLQAEENPEFSMKSVWVCNRVQAPKNRTEEDLRSGLAPLLIEEEVTDPSPIPAFDQEDIHFIWTEEGTGVSFFYKEELIAYLPPWSGVKDFHGYSIYAKIDAITAYPLGNAEFGIIPDRIRRDRNHWESRASNGSWKRIQELRLGFLENVFGKHEKYWSADGGKFPQLGIARFRWDLLPDVYIYATVGMSAQNMPGVELYRKDYEDYSRVELLFAAKISDEDRSESWIPHQIGEIIRFPWSMGKWFGHGHTISMSRRDPEALYVTFTSLLIKELDNRNGHPPLSGLLAENGKPIRFLSLLPISEEEKEVIQGRGANEFLSLWEKDNLVWIHDPERTSVI
ncbi:suppressor of fused protein [Leptospira fainei serovar Hurstbridge str. BUT 6]|uniref:Suppressor of fused protein n=1 Tax=Leptospira fainei serovar Hurstbridge str. BUT 6 TaxID=1193011 RepID=S3UWN4_9LEPT|nr:suppressor of fused domain protein [Leptospira fainei]EPG73678.1 suppressor of fused protein [Leptospira fainei serovar Hurstbridge str. BUT 6]